VGRIDKILDLGPIGSKRRDYFRGQFYFRSSAANPGGFGASSWTIFQGLPLIKNTHFFAWEGSNWGDLHFLGKGAL